jgi:hypothetical protein
VHDADLASQLKIPKVWNGLGTIQCIGEHHGESAKPAKRRRLYSSFGLYRMKQIRLSSGFFVPATDVLRNVDSNNQRM